VPRTSTISRAELLGGAVTRLFVTLREHLVAEGLSMPQVRVLTAIRDRGPLRVTELAAALQVTQPTMTAQVHRLESQGWLQRKEDDQDGRAVRVSLTSDGRALLASIVASRARLLDSGLDRLDPDETARIAAALPAQHHLADLLAASQGHAPPPAAAPATPSRTDDRTTP
jgi:DNA-binding MarR family transcriptional regulator